MAMNRNGRRGVEQPAGFSVASKRTKDGLRLVLRGDLDLASANDFEHAVSRAQQANPASIVVDLTRLAFLDSRGLRAILTVQRVCEEECCKLMLIPGEQAQRLFDLTGLTERLPLLGPQAVQDGTVS